MHFFLGNKAYIVQLFMLRPLCAAVGGGGGVRGNNSEGETAERGNRERGSMREGRKRGY